MRIVLPLLLALLAGCSTVDGSVKEGMFCRIGPAWNGAPSTVLYSSLHGKMACGDATLDFTPTAAPAVKP